MIPDYTFPLTLIVIGLGLIVIALSLIDNKLGKIIEVLKKTDQKTESQ